MPLIERTQQGDQYVLPGTERRTAPGLPYATEPDGQLALHFYVPPDRSERRRRAAGSGTARRKGLESQEECGGTPGLFGHRLAFFPQTAAQPQTIEAA